MATRLNRHHSASVLERIRLSQLVTRLQHNAMGTLKGASGGAGGAEKGKRHFVEMSEGQIRSAIFLIERRLARAEAPKTLNLDFAGKIQVEFVGTKK